MSTYGLDTLRVELSAFIDPETKQLYSSRKVKNLYAQIVGGALPKGKETERLNQMIKEYGDEFIIVKNLQSRLDNWSSYDSDWVGKAALSKNHVMLAMKTLDWKWFNILVWGMFDNLPEALRLLQRIKDVAKLFSKRMKSKGWSSNVGIFLHVYPDCEFNSFWCDLVDMEHLGPTYHHMKKKLLKIDDAIAVLQMEKMRTNAAAVKGVPIIRQRLNSLSNRINISRRGGVSVNALSQACIDSIRLRRMSKFSNIVMVLTSVIQIASGCDLFWGKCLLVHIFAGRHSFGG